VAEMHIFFSEFDLSGLPSRSPTLKSVSRLTNIYSTMSVDGMPWQSTIRSASDLSGDYTVASNQQLL